MHRMGENHGIKACIDCGYIGDNPPEECVRLNIGLSRRIDILDREVLLRYLLRKMRQIESRLLHCVELKSPDQRRREIHELYDEVVKINNEYIDKEIVPLSNFRRGVQNEKGKELLEDIPASIQTEDINKGSESEDYIIREGKKD